LRVHEEKKLNYILHTDSRKKTEVAPKRGLIAHAVNIQSNNGERRRVVNHYSDDIPGVSVSVEQIDTLTLEQLKFWLKSRRIN